MGRLNTIPYLTQKFLIKLLQNIDGESVYNVNVYQLTMIYTLYIYFYVNYTSTKLKKYKNSLIKNICIILRTEIGKIKDPPHKGKSQCTSLNYLL